METCGQCPGAVSPDLLLGRGRNYCDEGKAMFLELGCVCVEGSSAGHRHWCTPRDAQQLPRHLQWPGAISSVCCSSVVL